MTQAKQPSAIIEAVLGALTWTPFFCAHMLSTFLEAAAFALRFRRQYIAVLPPLLVANLASGLCGGVLLFALSLGLFHLREHEWTWEWSQAFGLFSYNPWLQLYGNWALLGLTLLIATPLEQSVLARKAAFAGIDTGDLRSFIRKVHYVTFTLLAALWAWRCWHLAKHPPPFY